MAFRSDPCSNSRPAAVWPHTDYLIPLSLSFLSWKVGLIIVSVRINWDNPCDVSCKVPSIWHGSVNANCYYWRLLWLCLWLKTALGSGCWCQICFQRTSSEVVFSLAQLPRKRVSRLSGVGAMTFVKCQPHTPVWVGDWFSSCAHSPASPH